MLTSPNLTTYPTSISTRSLKTTAGPPRSLTTKHQEVSASVKLIHLGTGQRRHTESLILIISSLKIRRVPCSCQTMAYRSELSTFTAQLSMKDDSYSQIINSLHRYSEAEEGKSLTYDALMGRDANIPKNS